jgi:hypothetical protein
MAPSPFFPWRFAHELSRAGRTRPRQSQSEYAPKILRKSFRVNFIIINTRARGARLFAVVFSS